MTHYVYRAWRKGSGALLYVGCTNDLSQRLESHTAQAMWWPAVDYVTHETYAERSDALAAEKAAIVNELPRWNVKNRHPHHPDGPAYITADVYHYHPEDCAAEPRGWSGVFGDGFAAGVSFSEQEYYFRRYGVPCPAHIQEAARREVEAMHKRHQDPELFKQDMARIRRARVTRSGSQHLRAS